MARTELFKRLPEAWKRLDYLYGGVLEKFLGVFDQEYDLRHDQIEDLLDLRTPNKAPDAYIHLLGRLIGYEWDYDKSYAWNRQRIMIAIRRYSYKGTLDAVEDVVIEAGGDEWWVLDMASTVVVPSRQGNLGTDNCYLVAPDYHHAGAYELQVTAAIDEMDVVNDHLNRNTAAGEYWYLATVPGTIPGDSAIKGGLLTMDSLLDLTKTEIQLHEGTSDNPLSELDAVIQACDENVFILSLGPSLWLDAYQGITLDSSDLLSAWADQSGQDHDASQGNVGYRPLYIDPLLNGKPGLSLDGDYMVMTEWAQSAQSTVFIVGLFPGTPSLYWLSNSGSSGEIYFYSPADSFRCTDGTATASASISPDTYFIGEAIFDTDANTAEVRVNCGTPGTTSSLNGGPENWRYIGLSNSVGEIFEVLIFDRELTLDKRYDICSYLSEKYNISIAEKPLTVPDCSLWLDAGQGITTDASGNVSDWEDLSSQGRDFSQATDTKRPAYVSSGLGGQPVVRFDGSQCLTKAGGFSQVNAMTVFAVLSIPASHDGIIWGGGASNGYIALPGIFGTSRLYSYPSGTSVTTSGLSFPIDLLHTYKWNRSGETMSMRINGVLTDSDTPPDTDGLLSISVLGGYNSTPAAYVLEGDIAELIMYDRELTSDEIGFLEDYLCGKYKISLPDKPPPLLIPDCSVWLDAGQGITLNGSDVTAWADQSQNGRDLSQTTPADRLTYVADAVNGKPVLRGTTGTPHMDFDYQVFPQKTDMTLFAVMKSNTPSGQSHTFERNPFVGYYFFGIGGDYLYIANGSHNLMGTTKVNSDYSICRWKLAGTDAEVCVNGGTPDTIDNADTDRSYWCEFGNATYPAMGDFAEFIMYDRELSTGEISFIENYLSEKYDIELGG